MRSVVHIITVPDSLLFIEGFIGALARGGYSVSVVASPGPKLDAFSRRTGIQVHAVEMPRRISPLEDLEALATLTRLLVRLKPDLVHAHTPKGGLLGMLAAQTAGVPTRIYHMHGLPLMTAKGALRSVLTATEQTACGQATHVLCQSTSLRRVALEQRLCPPEKIEVVLQGSTGVDSAGQYNPERLGAQRPALRAAWGIAKDALVVGFVGRLVRDKGIVELEEAWRGLREEFRNARLLVAGPFEPRDPVPPDVRARLEEDDRVTLLGFTEATAEVYAASDVVTLPSYREGFPTVPLEAAAMGLPVVSTDVPGCVDAVADGITGTLVPARDTGALVRALRRYLSDPSLRRAHGDAGRERVQRDFRRERVWEATKEVYRRLLSLREA
jgi:glycosyltransferase involved in cell wall biosynthesis